MPEVAYEAARRWAEHWAQRWFLGSDGEDRLQLSSGVEAGWASHVEAYLVLLDLALEELGEPPQRSTLLGRAKARGWDRAARSWGLRAAGSTALAAMEEPGVVFVAEIPTPSMLEPIRLVAEAIPREQRTVLCADPRALRALRAHGLDPVALGVPLRQQQGLLRSESRRVAELLAAIRTAPPDMLLDDRDFTAVALERLGRTMRRSLPWIAVESLALRRALEAIRPGALAIGSDQHRIGRLATHAARELGAPVTVLQHGLPQAELGYLPVVSDRVATWSADAARWFEDRGTDPARLAIVGNPRTDSLALSRSGRTKRSNGSGARLLLALSPTAISTNTRVVATVLDALAELPRAQLVVKLHPGHRDWTWVAGLVGASPNRDRVRVVQHEDIVGLLRWADVTLVHRSTVALESLVAGTPVMVVSSSAPSIADLELERLDLPSADDATALALAVREVSGPSGRAMWFEGRDPAIAEAAGPLDGRSTDRIASLLLEDAAEQR